MTRPNCAKGSHSELNWSRINQVVHQRPRKEGASFQQSRKITVFDISAAQMWQE